MAALAWQSPFSPLLPIPENILHPRDDRFLAFRNHHLDHIEPPRNLPGAEPPQPLVRAPLDQRLFLAVDRRETAHHRILPAGFHLGEEKLPTFPCHYIHLPAPPAFEISRKDLAPARPQPVGGDLLPVIPRPLARAARPRLRAEGRVEITAETTDDDGDKAHVFQVLQDAPACHSPCGV